MARRDREFLTIDDLILELEEFDDEFSRLCLEDMKQIKQDMIRALTSGYPNDA